MKSVKYLITLLLITSNWVFPQGSWEKIKTPVDTDLKHIFFPDSLNLWVAGDSGTILYSSDLGVTWSQQYSSTDSEINDIFFINDSVGWAVENGTDGINVFNNILSTTDGGNNWNAAQYRIDNITLFTICFTDSLNGWVGGDQSEFAYTTDAGLNWQPVDRDSGLFSFFPVRKIRFINDSVGFAVGGFFDFGGVIWGTRNGLNWQTDSAYADPFFDLVFLDSLTIISIASDIERSYPSAVFRTYDQGNIWILEEIPFYGVCRGLSNRTPNEIWGTFEKEYLFSFDAGLTWKTEPTLDSLYIYDVVFSDSLHGFIVCENGYLLKYKPQPPNSVYDDENIRNDFHLSQNYPNPFNPSTKIRFTIPSNVIQSEAKNLITLKIYDILGKEIATLVNEEKPAGTYEVEFNANSLSRGGGNLPSGIYYYQLKAGSFVETNKMILIK